jgi:hypothetical protein
MEKISCQDFKEGCCGCCVNMKWRRERLDLFLHDNTVAVDGMLAKRRKNVRLRDLVSVHLKRGGWADYLLAFILVPLTFGLSALLWKRVYGSCCFAGYLSEEAGRVGCLIHPLRLGGEADLRKHAFPLVPTLNCDRELRCPQLDNPGIPLETGWYEVSMAGAGSLAHLKTENRDSGI